MRLINGECYWVKVKEEWMIATYLDHFFYIKGIDVYSYTNDELKLGKKVSYLRKLWNKLK